MPLLPLAPRALRPEISLHDIGTGFAEALSVRHAQFGGL